MHARRQIDGVAAVWWALLGFGTPVGPVVGLLVAELGLGAGAEVLGLGAGAEVLGLGSVVAEVVVSSASGSSSSSLLIKK